MTVQMLCPNLRCRKLVSVSEEVRGKLVQCHQCQTKFRVPNSPTAAQPAAKPAR